MKANMGTLGRKELLQVIHLLSINQSRTKFKIGLSLYGILLQFQLTEGIKIPCDLRFTHRKGKPPCEKETGTKSLSINSPMI